MIQRITFRYIFDDSIRMIDDLNRVAYTHLMAINWSKLYTQYKGQWIALKDDEKSVVASGKNATETLKAARRKGYEQPILTHIPHNLHTYVGFV